MQAACVSVKSLIESDNPTICSAGLHIWSDILDEFSGARTDIASNIETALHPVALRQSSSAFARSALRGILETAFIPLQRITDNIIGPRDPLEDVSTVCMVIPPSPTYDNNNTDHSNNYSSNGNNDHNSNPPTTTADYSNIPYSSAPSPPLIPPPPPRYQWTAPSAATTSMTPTVLAASRVILQCLTFNFSGLSVDQAGVRL